MQSSSVPRSPAFPEHGEQNEARGVPLFPTPIGGNGNSLGQGYKKADIRRVPVHVWVLAVTSNLIALAVFTGIIP